LLQGERLGALGFEGIGGGTYALLGVSSRFEEGGVILQLLTALGISGAQRSGSLKLGQSRSWRSRRWWQPWARQLGGAQPPHRGGWARRPSSWLRSRAAWRGRREEAEAGGKTKEVHDLDHPLDTIVENAKRLRLRLDVDIGGHIIELSPIPNQP
jgi:hypothetical protein